MISACFGLLSLRTLRISKLFTVIGYSSDLLQQRQLCLTRLTDSMFQVTYCVGGTTVDMIAAAHGLQRIKYQTQRKVYSEKSLSRHIQYIKKQQEQKFTFLEAVPVSIWEKKTIYIKCWW